MSFQIDVFAYFCLSGRSYEIVPNSFLLEDFFGHPDSRYGIRPTGVEGKVSDGFDQLVLRYAIFTRPREMRMELFRAVHGNERGHRNQASVTLRQLRSLPNVCVEDVVG